MPRSLKMVECLVDLINNYLKIRFVIRIYLIIVLYFRSLVIYIEILRSNKTTSVLLKKFIFKF